MPLIPMGKGQRELIIGDRSTGKTAMAIDTIIDQKDANVFCISSSRSARRNSTVPRSPKSSNRRARSPARRRGGESLRGGCVALDRAVCRLRDGRRADVPRERRADRLRRSHQARAILPGDVAVAAPAAGPAKPTPATCSICTLACWSARQSSPTTSGGGSLTALPVIGTRAGDFSAYIPTNVISITDGQIYLTPQLFFQGCVRRSISGSPSLASASRRRRRR